MVKLSKEQLNTLAVMLAGDMPFAKIKEELNLNKNYNLKNLCDYYGKKYIKLYDSHINILKEKKEIVVKENNNLKEMMLHGFNSLAEILKKNNNVQNLLEQKENKNNDEIIIEKLPDHLPLEIQNYKVFDKISIRINGEINERFKEFIKENNKFKSAEFYSLAIFEFLEKYKG